MFWVLLIGGICASWVWLGRAADKAAAKCPEMQNYD